MGKQSRKRSKERRAQEKRARKAIMKAQYQQWAEAGKNSKSTRFRRKTEAKLKTRNPNCQNTGDMLSYQGKALEAFKDRILRMGDQYTGRYKYLRNDNMRTIMKFFGEYPRNYKKYFRTSTGRLL